MFLRGSLCVMLSNFSLIVLALLAKRNSICPVHGLTHAIVLSENLVFALALPRCVGLVRRGVKQDGEGGISHYLSQGVNFVARRPLAARMTSAPCQ